MAVISSKLRRTPEPPLPPVPVRKALVAAASSIPLDGTGWKNFKLGDAEWQNDGWKHYDICGELRYIANWVGSSISRCRLYVAKLDDLGKPGEEVTDKKIAILAETVFGGPAKKAEAQRLLGTHLFVPGESYIVAEGVANAKEDRWYVVSTTGIKRRGEREIQVERPQEFGGGWYTLKEGNDLLIRVWTPHPRKSDLADSSVRPSLPVLREIEALTKHEFAQIDSRLAGAGLLLLPDQLDFPRQDEDPPGAEGLMKVLERAMSAALSDRASPASLVPIMAQVPGEFIDKVRHITFETTLTRDGMEIRKEAIGRLGLSLDVDPEILMGKGDTNHWSAWQVDEGTLKTHIEPILARICDALTTGYLRAALTVMGQDPDKYTFWYDTSPLAVRPNRQADGLQLFEADALGEEALRKAGAWSEDDAPGDEERARRLATKLVLAQPDLIKQKSIQKALGVSWEIEQEEPPPAPGQEPNAPQEPTEDRALPEQPATTDSSARAALLMGAHMVVQRSLEMAGKRLLTRAHRDKYRESAPWDLHTHIRVLDGGHAARLLEDTFAPIPVLAMRTQVAPGLLRELLSTYCQELMTRGVSHDIDLLETFLEHGLHAECQPGEFCRAPLHPGPCKGWKKRLRQIAPGVADALDKAEKDKKSAPKKANPAKPKAESPQERLIKRHQAATAKVEQLQAELDAFDAEQAAKPKPKTMSESLPALYARKEIKNRLLNAQVEAFEVSDQMAKENTQLPMKPAVEEKKVADEGSFGERYGDAVKGRAALTLARINLEDLPAKVGSYSSKVVETALSAYKGSDYQSINSTLRKAKGNDDRLHEEDWSGDSWGDTVDAIDAAMDQSALPGDSVVWRGMGYPQGVFGAAWNNEDVSGLEWKDWAYTSTSANEKAALNFAQGHSGGVVGDPNQQVLMRILVGTGAKGVQLSAYDGEGELLLERGLTFRVAKDHGVQDGARRLDVMVVKAA